MSTETKPPRVQTMRKSDALTVIQHEINWCKSHLPPNCGRTPSTQQKIGFIKGLQQAKRMIRVLPRDSK